MDEQRRGGWQVCYDTAFAIKNFVGEELRKFGHLSSAVVALLRREAREDHKHHRVSGFSDGQGGPPAAGPKRKG